MFIKRVRAGMLTVAGATALALGGMSGSQAATDDLEVQATVVANCAITANPLDFGDYDPVDVNSATAAEATTTLSVTCTSGAAANVMLGQGTNPGPGSTDADPNRQLQNGTDVLSYGLFTDEDRLNEWGNTTATGVAHAGTGSAEDITVYGSIPAGQNVPAGVYTGTVVATIEL